MWIRNDTIVTTSSIAVDSGSMSAATSTRKSPTVMKLYSGTMLRSEPARTSRKMPIATTADAPIASEAIGPVHCLSQRRPNSTLIKNAASGKAGMSQALWINGLALHLVDLVHVHGRAVAVRGKDDREPDGDLGCRDHEHEHDEHAASLIERVARAELAGAPREGDEREVARVQHELDAHEDHDRVAADEHTGGADEEQDGRDRDERADRDRHCSSCFTRTIAPTSAASRSTDATS